MTKKKGKGVKKSTVQASRALPMTPPAFRSQVSKVHRMRYINDKQASSTVQFYTFTRGHLLNMYMQVGASSNAQRSWRVLGSIRLARVSLWSTAQTEVGYDTATLTWLGQYIPPVVVSDTGNSFRPIRLTSKPPPGSFAALWSVSASSIGGSPEDERLFSLEVPTQTTVDIEFEAIFFQYPLATGSPPQLIHPTSSLPFGTIAVPPLDQNPTSTTTVVGNWSPQGVIKLL